MLVSHRQKFVYVKTRKTAGTSVEIYFEPWCLDPSEPAELSHARPEFVSPYGIVGFRGTKTEGQRFSNHMSAAAIRDAIGAQAWGSYFKFCNVRNPFDKAVSFWWFNMTPDDRQATAQKSFSEIRTAFQDFAVRGRIPSDASSLFIDGLPCMDFVIRYERLIDDLEEACRMAGVPFEPERLGAFKRGIRLREEPFWQYYDDGSEAAVARALKREIELLGYAPSVARSVVP